MASGYCYSVNLSCRFPPPRTQEWDQIPFKSYNSHDLSSIGAHTYRSEYPQYRQARMSEGNEHVPNENTPIQNEDASMFPLPQQYKELMNNGADNQVLVSQELNETDSDSDEDVARDKWPYKPPVSLRYYIPDLDKRGIGAIFLNEKFTSPGNDRVGIDKDRDFLTKMFIEMRLEIVKHEELTSSQTLDALTKLAKYELTSNHHVLIVAFSTHGEENDIIHGSDGSSISLHKEVIPLFKPNKCKVLEGKPKVFLIQACRGSKEDLLVNKTIHNDALVRQDVFAMESDILIAYASAPNYTAYRTKREGSWFLSDLYQNYMQYCRQMHFTDILTVTTQSMLLRTDNKDNKKWIAQVTHRNSTLRKSLWFLPKGAKQIIPEAIPNLDPADANNCSLEEDPPSMQEPVHHDVHAKKEGPKATFEFLGRYDVIGSEFNGLGIILVNHKCGKLNRIGSQRDLQNFRHIFEKMRLKVAILENFERAIVLFRFIKSQVVAHQYSKSFFIAISTHGQSNDELGCYNGTTVTVTEIVGELQKDCTVGKPKVVLVQACRGDSEDTEMNHRIEADSSNSVATLQSDILLAFSCVAGYTAWRDEINGSWFVDSLRVCYDKMKGSYSLQQILLAANKYMLNHFESKNGYNGTIRQPCEMRSTLTEELYI